MTRAAPSASSSRCSRRKRGTRTIDDGPGGVSQGRRGASALGGRQAAPAFGQSPRQRVQARLGELCAAAPGVFRRAGFRQLSASPSSFPYIDWTPFFQTWELRGRYPAILDDPKQGEAARQIFEDAQAMLKRIVEEHWFDPKAASASGRPMPSATTSRSIRASRAPRSSRLSTPCASSLLRRDGKPNLALADFVAPAESGKADYVGAFVVTAGAQEGKIAERFAKANDDYGSIMVKALADRIAEAFAERMHERVRREFWGYVPDEKLTDEARLNEEYRGIRPAPGYPAQPDHTEKATLFELLDAETAHRRVT